VSGQQAPAPSAGATGIYAYGVVPGDTPREVFASARGVDPAQPVVLLSSGDLAAVTSAVSLAEFGADAIEANLRDPAWLEQKVRGHDAVLAAALGRTTVVPFRFGAIYESEQHVRAMLAERRDLAATLARLAGAVELGVAGYADRERLRRRLTDERHVPDEDRASGRAYLERRRLERDLDEALAAFAAESAQAAHERLAAAASDARLNAVRASDDGTREMVLNGAYLVRDEDAFRTAVAAVADEYAGRGILFDVTGPWPPYNFAEEEAE